ncbi:hypothetical protein H0H92_007850 [Tricholoma furcatifolium]|nr:hypothetical protein H0H92_007850 [Tricholoma furcatifolium]
MASHPALSQADAASSLLSLSIAAATAAPVALQAQTQSTPLSSSLGGQPQLSTSLGNGTGTRHHRRLASTGKTKRRLSDARDAANRPSPALLQSAATSLASLSLSSSPPPSNPAQISSSFTATSNALNGTPGSNVALSVSAPLSDGSNIPSTIGSATDGSSKLAESTPIPISVKGGKKRGVDHKCESCSKVM